MLLENKIAIITGGGWGIGRSIAIQFAREGADVAVIARTARQINHVAEEIQQLGRRCLAVPADISYEKDISYAFKHIHDDLGRIDILVKGSYSPGYWLQLKVSSNSELEELDQFLEEQWFKPVIGESCCDILVNKDTKKTAENIC